VLISICIPAYNSGEKLNRLLDSIRIQTFKDYEIVISDDSNNNAVEDAINSRYSDLKIRYFHNEKALGTPANWNNAVEKSEGQWIKLMHHDDWFNFENSLQLFVDAIGVDKNAKLIFSSYSNLNLDNGNKYDVIANKFDIVLLKKNYLNLFKNFIGNPSCTMVHSSLKPYQYDVRIKWFIDFDFYLWFFQKDKNFTYIQKPLITFAIHKEQVTAAVQNNPAVEIPESFLLYEKYSINILKNIFAYDFFWRMYRNLGLKNIEELEKYLGYKNNYKGIQDLINAQNLVNGKILKNGFVSKGLMLISYLRNKLFN
jgi:glycosyltransferase involved in cell wall biosynthesis